VQHSQQDDHGDDQRYGDLDQGEAPAGANAAGFGSRSWSRSALEGLDDRQGDPLAVAEEVLFRVFDLHLDLLEMDEVGIGATVQRVSSLPSFRSLMPYCMMVVVRFHKTDPVRGVGGPPLRAAADLIGVGPGSDLPRVK